MTDWNAGLYLKFEDERTRPAIDLLSRVSLVEADRCMDLGCGPGNSTALLTARFPTARVSGLDTSPAMIAAARERVPEADFTLGDLREWEPADRFDLIFANAVLQWLPGHATLLPRLVSFLKPGGILAVQMPDNIHEPTHRLMAEIARNGPWARTLSSAAGVRETIGSFDNYYAWLREAGCRVDLWRTIYVHVLDGPRAIVEWLKATGLRPYLDPLGDEARQDYLARYETEVGRAYPAQADGKVLLRFPRLFFVARRG